MAVLPLIGTRFASRLVCQLDERGVPTDRILSQVRLSRRVFDCARGEQVMPIHQLAVLYDHTAQTTGLWYAALLAQLPVLEGYGGLSVGLRLAMTVQQAVETFLSEAPALTGGSTHYACTYLDDKVVLYRSTLPIHVRTPSQTRQHELVMLWHMIEAIRVVMGPDWWPDEIWLATDDDVPGSPMLSRFNVRFRAPWLGIVFPRVLMASVVPPEPGPVLGARDFVPALREVIGGYLPAGRFTIKHLAEVTGISVRTLQRRLAAAGLTFSALMDEVRFARARRLLASPDLTTAEIAHEVGIANKMNLIRSFRRLTGMTPQTYRRLHLQQGDRCDAHRRSPGEGSAWPELCPATHCPARSLAQANRRAADRARGYA